MAEPEKSYPNDCRTSCCGGCISGPLLLLVMVSITSDSPDFGGILLLPFLMIFGTIFTWIGLSIYEIWQQYRKRKK